MSLNDDLKHLINSIAENNIQKAKSYAKVIINKDKTDKNKVFCNKMLLRLENQGLNMLELPFNIKHLATFEDVSLTFNESRYYLTKRESEIYDKIMRKQKVYGFMEQLGIPMINTTILYGETGTGKTTFGKYIAYKSGKPFLYLKFSECIDGLMGKTAKNVSQIFDFVRENECVLMLDEIDTVATKRANADRGADAETNRVSITLMQEFDRLLPNTIVIAATNRYDRIDEALIERFAIKEQVFKLNFEEKKEMVKKFYNSFNLPILVDLETYCKEDKTQRQINYDLIETVTKYVEENLELFETK